MKDFFKRWIYLPLVGLCDNISLLLWIYLPLTRLWDNIRLSILLNGIIFLGKVLGLSNADINNELHNNYNNGYDIKEDYEYKGGLVIIWQPLLDKQLIHLVNEAKRQK